VGFGPHERHVDKHTACTYDYYESATKASYDSGYIRPQSQCPGIKDLFAKTAQRPYPLPEDCIGADEKVIWQNPGKYLQLTIIDANIYYRLQK
jgi:hypothetical protein